MPDQYIIAGMWGILGFIAFAADDDAMLLICFFLGLFTLLLGG